MIRKLRRKFILINLLLVGLVLTVVFALLVGNVLSTPLRALPSLSV